MKKAQVMIGLLFLLGSLILSGRGLAAAQPTIERNVIGSAGGEEVIAPGNLYHLNGTLGEPIAGNFVQQANYGLASGFWANISPGYDPANNIYLPLIIKSN